MKLLTVLSPAGFLSLNISATTIAIEQNRQQVLGTSLDISVAIEESYRTDAEQAIDTAIAQIGQLEQQLSTWKTDSEITRLNRKHQLDKPSTALLGVVKLCEQWKEKSNNAFSCRLGRIKSQWKMAEEQQQLPNRVGLRKQARKIARIDFPLTGKGITLPKEFELDVDGLAKGFIIDQAFATLRAELKQATGIKVDIGGDGRYWGKNAKGENWQVGVADSRQPVDNAAMLATLNLADQAVAASGHSSRMRVIERRRLSHILDPKDGWPLYQAPSAIVVAQNTTTADALATALSSMEMNDGIDWVNQLDGVEALVVSETGLQLASDGWAQYAAGGEQSGGFKLAIDYRIPKINSDDYERPYLAIWVSTPDNKLVRSLLLLGQTERWARENTRWWRRVGRRHPDLLDGVARPTRRPGAYSLSWNGRDDFGKPVAAGEYILHLEASREHGGHDYRKEAVTLADKNFQIEGEAKGELGKFSISYQAQP